MWFEPAAVSDSSQAEGPEFHLEPRQLARSRSGNPWRKEARLRSPPLETEDDGRKVVVANTLRPPDFRMVVRSSGFAGSELFGLEAILPPCGGKPTRRSEHPASTCRSSAASAKTPEVRSSSARIGVPRSGPARPARRGRRLLRKHTQGGEACDSASIRGGCHPRSFPRGQPQASRGDDDDGHRLSPERAAVVRDAPSGHLFCHAPHRHHVVKNGVDAEALRARLLATYDAWGGAVPGRAQRRTRAHRQRDPARVPSFARSHELAQPGDRKDQPAEALGLTKPTTRPSLSRTGPRTRPIRLRRGRTRTLVPRRRRCRPTRPPHRYLNRSVRR